MSDCKTWIPPLPPGSVGVDCCGGFRVRIHAVDSKVMELVYVLLRFEAHLSNWGHSFTRLSAVVRAALWERVVLRDLLSGYGTAGGSFRVLGALQQAWLPGFARGPRDPVGQHHPIVSA